jgi:hypothetical protein
MHRHHIPHTPEWNDRDFESIVAMRAALPDLEIRIEIMDKGV